MHRIGKVVNAAGERTSGVERSCEACKVRLRSMVCAPAAELGGCGRAASSWRPRQPASSARCACSLILLINFFRSSAGCSAAGVLRGVAGQRAHVTIRRA